MHWGFSDLLFWESTNVYLFSVLRNESVFEKNIIVFYSSILTSVHWGVHCEFWLKKFKLQRVCGIA